MQAFTKNKTFCGMKFASGNCGLSGRNIGYSFDRLAKGEQSNIHRHADLW